MAIDQRLYPLGPGSDGSDYFEHIKTYSVTFDAANVTANTVSNQDVTLTGVETGDVVLGLQTSAALSAGLALTGARVKAANTVTVTIVNPTAGAVNNGAITLDVVVGRIKAAGSA